MLQVIKLPPLNAHSPQEKPTHNTDASHVVEPQLAGVLIQPTNSLPVFSIPLSVILEAVNPLRSYSNAVMFQKPQGLTWFIRRYSILSINSESYLLAFPKITKSPSQSAWRMVETRELKKA
jgi:hypothetical protein